MAYNFPVNYIERYRSSHQHPMNRLLHSIGIPILLISLPMLFWNWKWAIAVGALGWVFQFAGHIYERKMPLFFKNPAYLVVGPYWYFRKLFGYETKPR